MLPAPSRRAGAAPAQVLRHAGAELERLIRQVLEERLIAADIPDLHLLGAARRIAIRMELPRSGFALGADVLPRREGYEFRLISAAGALAEAERTKTRVYLLTVDRIEMMSDSTWMWIGTDVMEPPNSSGLDPNVFKRCCCEAPVQYRRDGDRWVFVKWDVGVCR